MEFQLFRVRVSFDAQESIFKRLSPSALVRKVIEAKPSRELRKNKSWKVANVAEVDELGLYFRFGRSGTTTLDQYDDAAAEFKQLLVETDPFTHVIYDSELQVAAIAAKPKLSPSVESIARQLEKVMNAYPLTSEQGARITVAPLRDPRGFLEQLSNAYKVLRFTFSFSRPNPIDVNKDFIGPLQRLAESVGARDGKTSIKGDALGGEVIEEITRSVASSGHTAEATVVPGQRSKPKKISLSGSLVEADIDAVESLAEQKEAIALVRETYRRVRVNDE